MTTVIKVGDKVTWQNKVNADAKSERVMPLKIIGCKVLALYDQDGKAVATIDTPLGPANAWADDLTLEKGDLTILSGG